MTKPNCPYALICKQRKTSDCTDACVRYTEMQHLLVSSTLPRARWQPVKLYPTCEKDTIAFKQLNAYKETIARHVARGDNLYICSNSVGNGKTSWSIKILLKYFDSIWYNNGLKTRGIFVSTPELLIQLKNFEHPLSIEYIDALYNCDLVVWDDIGCSNSLSEYEYNRLLAIIDHRIINKKSNIFTSNITKKDQFAEKLGGRLASRIYDTSKVIAITGGDLRGAAVSKVEENHD